MVRLGPDTGFCLKILYNYTPLLIIPDQDDIFIFSFREKVHNMKRNKSNPQSAYQC